jgi:hypothetical protein
MGKKIVFAFGGTGEKVGSLRNYYEEEQYADNVVRIYFSGCQNSSISGRLGFLGVIDPNLDVVAAGIRGCFKADGTLSMNELKKRFGDSVVIEGAEETDKEISVDSVHLEGFSRGAVTTFATARHLDDLNIPMTLVAQEPVPGDSSLNITNKNSEYYKNQDLTQVKNLQKAQVQLGAYSKSVNPIHDNFFRQMAPKFHQNCECKVYVMPIMDHFTQATMAYNQRLDFNNDCGIIPYNGIYPETQDNLFFVPKVQQQKFHTGIDDRTELLPRYTKKLYETVCEKGHDDCENASIKVLQALYALDQAPDSIAIDTDLYSRVKKDSSPHGVLLREFIVEFENCVQYLIKNNKFGTISPNDFRIGMYQNLSKLMQNPNDPKLQKEFMTNCKQLVSSTGNKIGILKSIEFNRLMNDFLNQKILFSPDLASSLKEDNPQASFGANLTQVRSVQPEYKALVSAVRERADSFHTRDRLGIADDDNHANSGKNRSNDDEEAEQANLPKGPF